jgi:hypothetical protein
LWSSPSTGTLEDARDDVRSIGALKAALTTLPSQPPDDEAAHSHPATVDLGRISVCSASAFIAVIPSACNEAFILNFMFTGVVNHWVTVLGIEAVSPARTEGESWVG